MVLLVYVVLIAPHGLEAATKNRAGNPALLNCVSHNGRRPLLRDGIPKRKDIIAKVDRIALFHHQESTHTLVWLRVTIRVVT